MTKKQKPLTVAMLGASGAVGGEALKTLLCLPNLAKITSFGRRTLAHALSIQVKQFQIDVNDEKAYGARLKNHDVAICALGVGQPSKVSREEFVRIDKMAALHFAKACKNAGIGHFQLLAAAGINPESKLFYLRTKGELVKELQALQFKRLSIFQPSTIITPTNRYGLMQAILLKVAPWINPLLLGRWRKYRGVPVDVLGAAMAENAASKGKGDEFLHFDDFYKVIGE